MLLVSLNSFNIYSRLLRLRTVRHSNILSNRFRAVNKATDWKLLNEFYNSFKVKIFDLFQVELHLVTDAQDCRPIGQASIKLTEVLDVPSNKLHGSVILYAATTQKTQPAKTNILGTLEYWFKLHTSGDSFGGLR